MLITGTGRMGGMWLATILQELGLAVHHSCPWTTGGPSHLINPQARVMVYEEGLEERYPRYALLVRNPYDCIPSLYRMYERAGHPAPDVKSVARYWWVNSTLMSNAECVLKAEDRLGTVKSALCFITGERVKQGSRMEQEILQAMGKFRYVNAGVLSAGDTFDWGQYDEAFLWPIHDMARELGYDRPGAN